MPPPSFARFASSLAVVAAGTALSGSASAQRVQRNIPLTPIIHYRTWLAAGSHILRTHNTSSGGDPVMHVGLETATSNVVELDSSDDVEGWNPKITLALLWGQTVTVIIYAYGTYSTGTTSLEIDGVDAFAARPFAGVKRSVDAGPFHYETAIEPFAFTSSLYPFYVDPLLYAFEPNGTLQGAWTGYDDDRGVGLNSRIDGWTLGAPTPTRVIVGGLGDGMAAVYVNDISTDSDGDGLGAVLEATIGTCDSTSQPGCNDPSKCAELNKPTPDPLLVARCLIDRDRDGLSDRDEVFGAEPPGGFGWEQHFPAMGASPIIKDVFIQADWQSSGAPTPSPFSETMIASVATALDPPESIFGVAHHAGNGYRLHVDIGTPCTNLTLCGEWGGAKAVAWAEANGRTATPGGACVTDGDCGSPDQTCIAAKCNTWNVALGLMAGRRGKFRYTTASLSAGGGSGVVTEVFNFGPASDSQAFAHELGHSLGIEHWGNDEFGRMNFKPHYASVMNYNWQFGTPPRYSRGVNTEVLNPASMTELGAYSGYLHDPSTYLDQIDLLNAQMYFFKFNYDFTTRSADWNLDGVKQTAAIRATPCLPRNRPNEADFFGANREPLFIEPGATTTLKDIQITRLENRLFFFWQKGEAIYYRVADIGPADSRGSCTGINGDVLVRDVLAQGDPRCLTWGTERQLTLAGPTRAFAITSWEKDADPGGSSPEKAIVVTYILSASGGATPSFLATYATYDATTGNINPVATTNLGAAPTTVTSDARPGISVMHVLPANFDGAQRVVAILAKDSAGDYHLWSSSGLAAPFVDRGPILDGAGTVMASGGAFRPSMVAYPDPNNGGLTFAGACAALRHPTSGVTLNCYDKSLHRWRDMGCFSLTTTGPCTPIGPTDDPTLVFHHTRYASGAPIAVGEGAFWLVTPFVAGGEQVWHRTSRILPTVAPWTAGPTLLTIGAWTYGTFGPMALFEDLRTSAMKGGVAYKPKNENPAVHFMPLADGTAWAQLKDGNDYRVIERGICKGLKGPVTAGPVCGDKYPDTF